MTVDLTLDLTFKINNNSIRIFDKCEDLIAIATNEHPALVIVRLDSKECAPNTLVEFLLSFQENSRTGCFRYHLDGNEQEIIDNFYFIAMDILDGSPLLKPDNIVNNEFCAIGSFGVYCGGNIGSTQVRVVSRS